MAENNFIVKANSYISQYNSVINSLGLGVYDGLLAKKYQTNVTRTNSVNTNKEPVVHNDHAVGDDYLDTTGVYYFNYGDIYNTLNRNIGGSTYMNEYSVLDEGTELGQRYPILWGMSDRKTPLFLADKERDAYSHYKKYAQDYYGTLSMDDANALKQSQSGYTTGVKRSFTIGGSSNPNADTDTLLGKLSSAILGNIVSTRNTRKKERGFPSITNINYYGKGRTDIEESQDIDSLDTAIGISSSEGMPEFGIKEDYAFIGFDNSNVEYSYSAVNNTNYSLFDRWGELSNGVISMSSSPAYNSILKSTTVSAGGNGGTLYLSSNPTIDMSQFLLQNLKYKGNLVGSDSFQTYFAKHNFLIAIDDASAKHRYYISPNAYDQELTEQHYNFHYDEGQLQGGNQGTGDIGSNHGKYFITNSVGTYGKDLLNVTNNAFRNAKYDTIISKFCTQHLRDDDKKNTTQSAISTRFGMSHGRNLLKVNKDSKTKKAISVDTSGGNGYDNPYCRVWTYHHQYHRLCDTIRPLTEYSDGGCIYGAETGMQTRQIAQFRNSTITGTDVKNRSSYDLQYSDGQELLYNEGVMNKYNGLINITPTVENNAKENVDIRHCMFSIENLAWKDVSRETYDLSEEQQGPFGGRIMWFPPYDLSFDEVSQAQWQPYSFIGRGEKIYTYTDAERSGNLSFTMLIDHPSVLNIWRGNSEADGDGTQDVDDIESAEQTILRFFAGCETLDPLASKPKDKPCDPNTDPNHCEEKVEEPTPEPQPEPEPEPSKPGQFTFMVYYPNNYSGADDEYETALSYLLNGVMFGLTTSKDYSMTFDNMMNTTYTLSDASISPINLEDYKSWDSGSTLEEGIGQMPVDTSGYTKGQCEAILKIFAENAKTSAITQVYANATWDELAVSADTKLKNEFKTFNISTIVDYYRVNIHSLDLAKPIWEYTVEEFTKYCNSNTGYIYDATKYLGSIENHKAVLLSYPSDNTSKKYSYVILEWNYFYKIAQAAEGHSKEIKVLGDEFCGGYEMIGGKHSSTYGVSTSAYTNEMHFSRDKLTSTDADGNALSYNYTKNTCKNGYSYRASQKINVVNHDTSQGDTNWYEFVCPWNRSHYRGCKYNSSKASWAYRVDIIKQPQLLNVIGTTYNNYIDAKTYGLNATGYEQTREYFKDFWDNGNVYSFADVFAALMPQYENSLVLSGCTNSDNIDAIRKAVDDGITKITIQGCASRQGNYKGTVVNNSSTDTKNTENDELSNNRRNTIKDWLMNTDVVKKASEQDTEKLWDFADPFPRTSNSNDGSVSGLEVKGHRCTIVTIHYGGATTENASEGNTKYEGHYQSGTTLGILENIRDNSKGQDISDIVEWESEEKGLLHYKYQTVTSTLMAFKVDNGKSLGQFDFPKLVNDMTDDDFLEYANEHMDQIYNLSSYSGATNIMFARYPYSYDTIKTYRYLIVTNKGNGVDNGVWPQICDVQEDLKTELDTYPDAARQSHYYDAYSGLVKHWSDAEYEAETQANNVHDPIPFDGDINQQTIREGDPNEGKEDTKDTTNTSNTTSAKKEHSVRYDNEAEFFKRLEVNDPFLHHRIKDKIKYFDPAFHSITPEGFAARLTFLQQCARQGCTITHSDNAAIADGKTASNLAFGRPPVCVLRIGDFYYTKIIIDSIKIDYKKGDGIQWDLNTEGIGIMPMMASINISFKFIGGSDLNGPINRLQNAMSFNYYANTRVYDNRSDEVTYSYMDKSNENNVRGDGSSKITPWMPTIE